jgi:hypothetical protein
MRLLSLFAVAMAGLIAVPALAQTPPPDGTPTRVRGPSRSSTTTI